MQLLDNIHTVFTAVLNINLRQEGRVDPNLLFQVLGSRCLTGSALLDCHVLKGFGIYMIGILDS